MLWLTNQDGLSSALDDKDWVENGKEAVGCLATSRQDSENLAVNVFPYSLSQSMHVDVDMGANSVNLVFA